MNYKYTNFNSTKHRDLYMYCEYNGKSFLQSYARTRSLIINNILKFHKGVVYKKYLKSLNDYDKTNSMFELVFFSFDKINSKKKIDESNFEYIAFIIDELFKKIIKKKKT